VDHAQRSEAESKIRAMIRSAESEPEVVTTPKHLDTNPWLLNVKNGTVDLSTGQLRSHQREDLITKLAPVEYVPGARSGWWENFLNRVVPDPDVRAFLQRAVGYSLTARTDDEVLFMIQGPGATGKTTFIEGIKAVLGDYAVTTDPDTFLKRSGDGGIRNDLARLAGARFVSSVEVDHGKRLAESLVKRVTGADTLSPRFLYREHFEFTPRFKLWLAANFRPQVTAHDSALWRRILLIPFKVVIAERARKPEVKRRLREDPGVRSAILAWAVQGCLVWQKQGLQVPDVIRMYTRQYRRENDVFQRWLDERAVLKADAVTGAGMLRRSHEAWAQANGLEPVPVQIWGQRLRSAGCKEGKTNKGTSRVWRGIGLA
jgi:putative DNA primase/helicase